MIKKLQNTTEEGANKIRDVFQISYAVEAKILNTKEFPPLKRPMQGYLESDNDFFGYFSKETLAGVVEIRNTPNFTHIQSLVVHPEHFRKGIARELMEFVFNVYDSKLFMVETGVQNGPATNLYKKLGFIETAQWDTEFGIRKIRFEKRL